MKRLACLALAVLIPVSASASDRMFAYCSIRPNDGQNISYVTKVFTVKTDALMVGYEVPEMAVNVASYSRDDMQGQFKAMVESEGLDPGDAHCFAAGTMEDLTGHYERGNQYVTRVKSRFGTWDPEGDFVFSSELWPD
jgi:hypothetical protein